jgi:5-methylcytosine-specific restriction endonuclease McrA
MPPLESKPCKDCGRILPVSREYFGQFKNMREGVASIGYRNSCRQCMAKHTARHSEANPDQRARRAAERIDREINGGGAFDERDVVVIGVALGGRCRFCDAPLEAKSHIEHLTPVSRGGSSHRRNISLACGPCNLAKTNKTLVEFQQWRAERGLKNRVVHVPGEAPDPPIGKAGRAS